MFWGALAAGPEMTEAPALGAVVCGSVARLEVTSASMLEDC
jgi:hypothetical protein